MHCTIERLEWDSNFFNMQVCKISGIMSDELDIVAIAKALKKQQVNLVYYSSSLPLTNNFIDILKDYYILLVDKKKTYLKIR